MNSYILFVCALMSVVMLTVGKPVKRGPPQPHTKEDESKKEDHSPEEKPDTGLPYDHYLRQVVDVLESDPEFKKKLETANITDIKNGNIAMHLEMVNHNVRSALDELKRKEVSRLQELARLQIQGTSGIDLIKNAMYRGDRNNVKNFEIPSHLDLKNLHSFEMSDLKKLILKTTADLEKMDKQQEAEFKQYEMEKEYEKNKHLNELSVEERKKEEARLESLKKKHADHPKLNHPGSKDHFEAVWEQEDHLQGQDFNPRTFFFKHDVNGDMELSIDEVAALVQSELDKVYDSRNSPDEDDPIEREAEMNRMRKHIFDEIDTDNNFRITLKEFLKYTGVQGNDPKFEKDEGWKTIDEAPVFSEEEYQKFVESQHGDHHSQDLKFQSEQGHQQQAPQEPHQQAPQEPHQQGQQQAPQEPYQQGQQQAQQNVQQQGHVNQQQQNEQQHNQQAQLKPDGHKDTHEDTQGRLEH